MKRTTALNMGLVKYEMDSPCRKGHIGERYASTGQCIECAKKYQNVIKAQRRDVKNAKLVGEIIMRLSVHPGDMLAIDAFADAMRINRRMMEADALRAQIEDRTP